MEPTLFKKGNLVPRMGESKDVLRNIIPIDYIMNWFNTKLIETPKSMNDRVVILLSKTGSGKSTAIGPNLFMRFNHKVRKQILITQPRILTAIEIPKNIQKGAYYTTPNQYGNYLELYHNLGFQTKEFVRNPIRQGVLFTTDGILLQFLKNMTDKEFIMQFQYIIIDEAHERTLNIDIILLLLKNLIQRNRNPPFLILMSATLNVDEYSKYFNTKTIFEVIGQSKPVATIYPKYDITNILTKIGETILNIHNSNYLDFVNDNGTINYNSKSDILIFVPNKKIISEIIKLIYNYNKKLEYKIQPVKLTSSDITQVSDEYKRLWMVDKNYSRKLIIATNVAETGLTLENLKYCIDTGFKTAVVFNARYNTNMIFNQKPITQSESLQRRGRVGRTQPGMFFPLYTEDTFNNMIVNVNPNIYINDITMHLLNIKSILDLVDLRDIDWMNNPTDDSIDLALNKLFILGAIDSNQKITDMGKYINHINKLPIESIKMIFTGIYYDINILDLVTIACCAAIGKNKIIENKQKYKIPDDRISCDFIEILILFTILKKIIKNNIFDLKKIKNWCEDLGLNYNTMLSIQRNINEVIRNLLEINIDACTTHIPSLHDLLILSTHNSENEFLERIANIKKCIYEGYKLNLLVLQHEGNYKSVINNMDIVVGSRFIQSKPKYLICDNMSFNYNSYIKKYEFTANSFISVLDGFIDTIDLTFLQS